MAERASSVVKGRSEKVRELMREVERIDRASVAVRYPS